MALNKITGLYGFLALFTGYHLNPLQLSHYIYSLVVLALVAWLHPAIRQREEVFKNIALAWIYVLDTLINSAYTGLFGAGWFVLLAQHLNEPVPIVGGEAGDAPGKSTMDDTAGFTNPEINASKVDVVATPATGVKVGQEAVAIPAHGALSSAVFQSGSLASITVIGILWMIRVYFCLVVMSYARGVLRQYVANTSNTSYTQPEDTNLAENPFGGHREEGSGWRGKLGRFMTRFPTKGYWLGRDENEAEWVRATSGRFSTAKELRIRTPQGVEERERRARSGTDPPPMRKPGNQ